MITVHADKLHRALSMTQEIAKAADRTLTTLRCVQVEATSEGLIARSTDRYQIIHARVPYVADPEPMPELVLSTDDIKALLPVLKREKAAPVTLEVDAEKVTLTFHAGHRMEYANQDVDFPSIKKLPVEPVEGINAPDAIGLQPAFLGTIAKLKQFSKNEPVMFTAESESKPFRWTFSDWAVGMVMPVRLSGGDSGTDQRRRDAAWVNAEPITAEENVAEAS